MRNAGGSSGRTANQLPPSQTGYVVASQTQGFFTPPGSNGFTCLGGDVGRYNGNVGQGPSFSLLIDLTSIPYLGGVEHAALSRVSGRKPKSPRASPTVRSSTGSASGAASATTAATRGASPASSRRLLQPEGGELYLRDKGDTTSAPRPGPPRRELLEWVPRHPKPARSR